MTDQQAERGSDAHMDLDQRNLVDEQYADYIKSADEEERKSDRAKPIDDEEEEYGDLADLS